MSEDTPFWVKIMTEKEILISRIADKKNQAEDNLMITNTFFLSAEERSDVMNSFRSTAEIKTFYFGGYDDAERAVAMFVPDFYNISDITAFMKDNPDDNPLSLLEIKKDRFSDLSHRDYLGAIMGLGIKREMIGDIITTEEGCYVFCINSIAKYICENLTKAGRGTLKIEIISNEMLPEKNDNFDEIFLSLASLRLDGVVSSAFNISRNLASEAINKGIVFVNSLRIFKSDAPVKKGDKVVFRGKGKIVISDIIGTNKKGRTHITVKKYK